MPGFDKDEFWKKILSMYQSAKENNYILKLNEEQVRELKEIFVDVYIPIEKLRFYDDEKLMKKMMETIVSIYVHDKDAMNNGGDIIHLVSAVNSDGRNLYLHYAKIATAKMRRFELGKTQQQIAERMGCNVSAVRSCELPYCDLSRQSETLVRKLAKALECDIESLMN